MADESAPSQRQLWTMRAMLGCAYLALASALVVVLLIKGDPHNPLHQAAHGSAWWTIWGVLAAFGLGAVATASAGLPLPWTSKPQQ